MATRGIRTKRYKLRAVYKHPPLGSRVNDKNLDYLAGFLDGEGCFTWKGGGQPYYGGPMLQCSNTYIPVLHMLQRRFGGSIYTEPRMKEHHRQAWRWQLTGAGARDALRILIPLLLEKKRQAELLIQAWKTDPPKRLPTIAAIKAAKRQLFTGTEGE